MAEKTILCMGSINIDVVMYMKKMPEVGQTVATDNFATFPGGKAGNQAAVAATLGGKVRFFTKLGDDDFSKQLTQGLTERGVDMSRVITVPGETSGVAMIRVDEQGRNSISFTSGANARLTPADVREHADVFDGCDILLITLEIQLETVYEAIRLAKEKHMTVIIDPSPVPAGGLPPEICKLIDYAKPNEIEAEEITGVPVKDMQSARLAYEKMTALGYGNPIISMSSQGAYTMVDQKPYILKPKQVNAIDSTAAGDVFLGSLAAALSLGKSLADCLQFANTAAALSTTRKGAQSSIPSPAEVEAAL